MRRFMNVSIRTNLILFTLGIAATAMAAGLAVALINDVTHQRRKLAEGSRALARLAAENCVYALEFHNPGEAAEVLAQLAGLEGFRAAALYTPDQNVFAAYPPEAAVPAAVPNAWIFTRPFSPEGRLEGVERIVFNNEQLGTLYLSLSTAELADGLRRNLRAMLLIFVGTMLPAALLVLRLQHLISRPIIDLAEVTQRISEQGDYSLRVGTTSGKENIVLYHAFNSMLDQIQEERRKLAGFNETLEAQVRERTAQLEASLEDLARTNTQLEEANRHKTRFLSAMSHELRTPLNAVLGFSDLLAGKHFGDLNARQMKYVRQIEESGKHLLDLINDLLDVAKIDAGAMELTLEPFSLVACAEETLTMLSTQIHKKQLTTRLHAAPDLPDLVADRRKIRQIFLNLFANAIKYTPEHTGLIEVFVAKPGARFQVRVADNGLGIAPEDRHKVFSEFYQVDRRRDEVLGGTGIGLALTRRLVEMHGGEIGVRGRAEGGSDFWFTLPSKTPPAPRPDAHERDGDGPARTRGARILVVEDNEVNRAMIIDMLAIGDHEVVVATNGAEALTLAEHHAPDLILMDIRMPVMDGLEATRRLRAMPRFAHIPIVALTASVEPHSRRRCREAGCSAHLAKPVQTSELFAMIEAQLSPSEKAPDAPQA